MITAGSCFVAIMPLDGAVPFCLGDRVGVGERREREALVDRPTVPHAVNAGGAHVDEAADTRGERRPATFSVPVTLTAR